MKDIPVKKIILIVLAILGAFFVLLVLSLVLILAIYKPFGIGIQDLPSAIIKSQTGSAVSTYDHPLLTTEQEKTLESLGVNTKTLPTSITAAQLACFTTKLGAARVQEIENGSAIGPSDYLKARSCIQ
ncbi:MAG: hypothetical protein WC813_01085 [Patescibacteria group bacterium]|jgi:hypothetical protein